MLVDRIELFEDYNAAIKENSNEYHKYELTIYKGDALVQITPYGGKLMYTTNDYKEFAQNYSEEKMKEDIINILNI